MLNKKQMLGISFLFIIGIVSGAVIGTIITQAQFDQIDFENRSLEISVDTKFKDESSVGIIIDYKTLEKLGNGDWEIIGSSAKFSYPLENYHECRTDLNSTKSSCVQEARNELIQQVKQFKTQERTNLADQKTKIITDEITANDLTFTDAELNAD